jgi:hypothetical protein
MAKIIGLILVVFVAAFVLGFSTPTADAGSCYYKCSCSGQPLRCCNFGFGEVCKPAKDFECPQIYTC